MDLNYKRPKYNIMDDIFANSDELFIRTERQYVEEDKIFIDYVKEFISVMEKYYEISPSSRRIKNVIDAGKDLIQYEEEKLESRISLFPEYFSDKIKNHLNNLINNN